MTARHRTRPNSRHRRHSAADRRLTLTHAFLASFIFFFLIIRRPPSSTLFPYPTLFRSHTSESSHGSISYAVFWIQTCADRKNTRLNSSHGSISYADFSLKKKKQQL